MGNEKTGIDKDELEGLLGSIDGYGRAVEQLEQYMRIYLYSERDRAAVSSVGRLGRQWDELSGWRLEEVKQLSKIFHGMASRVAGAAAHFLDEDVEIAARYPNELLNGDNVISEKLLHDARDQWREPLDRRWADDPNPEPSDISRAVNDPDVRRRCRERDRLR